MHPMSSSSLKKTHALAQQKKNPCLSEDLSSFESAE